ncbi:MAG: hypothetical protein IJJ23_10710 [Clostridia bacterium]|nr:hypothetical protein [Clostridia bacterium]
MNCQIYEFFLTVAMGKRLIAMGLMAEPEVKAAMTEHRLVIVAGTTNLYVAEEALKAVGDETPFDKKLYHRGVTVAPGAKIEPGQTPFDLVIDHGKARFDADIFKIAGELTTGDMIMKGGNALHLESRQAGVLIGHPQGGTLMSITAAHIGQRAQVIVPIGLEKRVDRPITELMALTNALKAQGPRLSYIPGRPYTELDALRALTGAEAELIAAGGVCGAEGGVYLAAKGSAEAVERVREIVKSLRAEAPTEI